MTWVKISDSFAEDPRIEAAGGFAPLGLYVAAVSYCNRNLTDGVLTKARVRTLGPDPDIESLSQSLIDAGLWADEGDAISIIDYHDTQPTSDEVHLRRAQSAARQKAWRDRGKASRNAVTNSMSDAVSHSVSNAYPDPPRPVRARGEGGDVQASSAGATDALPSTNSERPPATMTTRIDENGQKVFRMPKPAWSPPS